MKKILPFFVLLICGQSLFSQMNPSPYVYRFISEDQHKAHFILSNSLFSSPAAILSWYNYFHLIHFADPDLYASATSKLREYNYFGTSLNNHISWSSSFDTATKFIFLADMRQDVFQYTQFSKDAYHLLLDGNAIFEGETAYFAPFRYRSAHTQQIGLGGMRVFSDERQTFGIGLTINLINKSSFNLINISKGSLFTSENGDSLHADLRLDIVRSSDGQFFSFPGFSADLHFFFQGNSNNFYFTLGNLGVNVWKNARVFSIDTSFSMTGFDPLHKDGFKNYLLNPERLDSLLDYNGFSEKINFIQKLNPVFGFVWRYMNSSKPLGMQTSLYFNTLYPYPRTSVSFVYSPMKAGMLMPGVLLDEYGRTGVFFESEFALGKHHLRLGTLHLESPLLIKSNGHSWYVGYSLLW